MPHGVLGDKLGWRVPSPGSCLGGVRRGEQTLRQAKQLLSMPQSCCVISDISLGTARSKTSPDFCSLGVQEPETRPWALDFERCGGHRVLNF